MPAESKRVNDIIGYIYSNIRYLLLIIFHGIPNVEAIQFPDYPQFSAVFRADSRSLAKVAGNPVQICITIQPTVFDLKEYTRNSNATFRISTTNHKGLLPV